MNLFSKSIKYFKLRTLFLFGKIRSLSSPRQFSIKKGYRHRKQTIYFDDRPMTDEFQDEVYQLARYYTGYYNYKTILDLGCGSGYKLLKYFSGFTTTGIEMSPTYEFLTKKYPGRNWINLEELDKLANRNSGLAADLIICADVIEHVKDPLELLQQLKSMKFQLLFISTPERDLVRGSVDYGPPDNPAHVREWNAAEFRDFLGDHFEIISHQITNIEQATQLVVCRPVS